MSTDKYIVEEFQFATRELDQGILGDGNYFYGNVYVMGTPDTPRKPGQVEIISLQRPRDTTRAR